MLLPCLLTSVWRLVPPIRFSGPRATRGKSSRHMFDVVMNSTEDFLAPT